MVEDTDDAAATDDADGSSSGHTGSRSSRSWWVGLLLVVVIYGLGLMIVGVEDALAAFADASMLPLVAAGALQVAVVVAWGKVYGSSAAAVDDPVGTSGALQVSMPAFTLSHTLPGGGWAANALAIQRLTALGLSGPSATAAVALASTISLTTIATLGAAGILTAFLAGDLPAMALVIALPAVVLLVGLVATVVAVLHSPATGDRLVTRLGRILPDRLGGRVEDWRDSLRDVTHDPPTSRQLSTIGLWALTKWSADIASLACVFVALGATPRISALLVGFGVTQLATAIPVTPGGVGFAEGGMVGAFVTLGYPAALATSVVLVYRVLATWLPALAGVPLLVRQPDPDVSRAPG